MKLLRQTTSGEIYIWDAELAKRPDMEDYAKPVVQSEPVLEEQAEIEVIEVEEIVAAEAPVEIKPAAKKPARKSNGK
jgi:hypothetical protein